MGLDLEEYVREILRDIRKRGIEAVVEYSKKFDGYDGPFRVTEEEFREAVESIPERDREIILRTVERLWEYHERQKPKEELFVKNGSLYGLIYRPIRRIGIYVPGGKPLPSTLMMVAVPAKIAGVKEIAVTIPPKDGKVNPYVLYVAELLGIDEVYKLGGVQAIGAMAYGVGMKKVDKIFGPGNKFVNEAKRQVFGVVGIDSLAGPSEIAVIADETAEREYVLADLLSQLEHGKDSRAWLLTTSKELAEYCSREGIEVVLCDTLEECARKVNEIAPEHLEIITAEPMELVDLIENAGAIYLGSYTPVPAADYFLGVNHVLPTGGAAKFSGVLTVRDFLKPISLAQVGREEFLAERELGIRLAEIEGMAFHRRSMEVRK
ncbi:histidinol dehydrogenase [Thermococcus thioreducens]|uniref:Histidinol dehydrogenase n=1 Tax=Thermococcus thioreducens TaxID=277988 RepID=A0A0Q2RDM5_9EURY|nr:histidinol dehydrogenase [Thermococcus thioreducens]ASJ12725.1 histidinol dehydrogenase [Thermococcus thioreducens]KQH82054.1 histidinol dehydrogenase [Thermococcus thioreducens]SEV86158.1 histidinol dehydrogenase [Thermococcus thioreducens]